MLRGSSFLLEKSLGHYRNLIIAISKMNPELWEVDLDNYDESNIELLLNCKQQIIEALGRENNPSDTLVTKIMLGVFANVPAFDQYVKKTFGVWVVNKNSLLKIRDFYNINKSVIDSFKIYTFDFLTSQETDIIYTRAKLLDMYGFIYGSQNQF